MLIREIDTPDTAPSSIANGMMLGVMLNNDKSMIVVEIYYHNADQKKQMLKMNISKNEKDYFYTFHHSGKYAPSAYTKSSKENIKHVISVIVNDVLAQYFDRLNMGITYNPVEDQVVYKTLIYKFDIVDSRDKTYTKINIDLPDIKSILDSNVLYQFYEDKDCETLITMCDVVSTVDDIPLTFRIDIEKNFILNMPHFTLRFCKYNNHDMSDYPIIFNHKTLSLCDFSSMEEMYQDLYKSFEELIRTQSRISHACATGDIKIESYLLKNNKNK